MEVHSIAALQWKDVRYRAIQQATFALQSSMSVALMAKAVSAGKPENFCWCSYSVPTC